MASMATVGRAEVDIVADASGFAKDAEREINREVRKIDVDTTKIDRDVNRNMVEGFALAAGNAASSFIRALQGGITNVPPVVALFLLGGLVAAMIPVGAAAGAALILGLGGALAGLGIFFAAKNEEIREQFSTLFTNLGEQMETISQPFIASLETLAEVMEETFGAFFGPLRVGFEELAPIMSEFFEMLGEAFEALAPAIEPILEAFGRLLEELGPVLAEEVFPDLADALINLADAVSANAPLLADLIGWFIAAVEAGINFIAFLVRLAGAFGALKARADAELQELKALVSRIWNGIKSFLSGVMAGIYANAARAWSSITSAISNALGTIGNFISRAWSNFSALISRNWNNIKATVQRGVNAVINFVASIPDRVASIASGAWNSLVSSFKSAINSIIGAWNGLSFTIPSISAFGKTLGGGTVSTPDIPYVQQGGLIERAGIARVGEGGPETVFLPAGAVVTPNSAGNPLEGSTEVRVFIGEREITDIVVEIVNGQNRRMRQGALAGAGSGR